MLRPTMANRRTRPARADRPRPHRADRGAHLNPLHTEGVPIVRDGVEKLEAPNYADLYRRFGFRLDELADQCRGLLDSTEKVYEQAADKLFQSRVGVSLDDARRWDVIRTSARRSGIPVPEGEDARARATSSDMGVDLKSQQNVELDVERRLTARVLPPIEFPAGSSSSFSRWAGQTTGAPSSTKGRAHRALREHLRGARHGGEASRRRGRHRGLGDAHAAA